MPEHLDQLHRVGIVQLEEKTDDMFARRDVGFVGNDRDAGVARAFVSADNFHDVALGRHERIAVHEEIDLDDLDGLFARDRPVEEDVHLTLDEVVHDELLAGERSVKVEDVLHVAVGVLEGDGPVG